MRFLTDLPRNVFLTGKGGVGKTSVACALATRLADEGRRVLLISTDPASNVGQVFGVEVGHRIVSVPDVPGLDAIEIDPEEAVHRYRERTLAPVRDFLKPEDLAAATEQLSGSCTTEVASFNEFTELLAEPARTAAYDHVIFDTAPTGHTIRLLELPGEWTGFLDEGLGDASCLGPMSGLDKARGTYAAAVESLASPERTRIILVARADRSSLDEAERALLELATVGIHVTHLVVNGILPQEEIHDALGDAIRAREAQALQQLPLGLRRLELDSLPLRATNMVGVDALRRMFSPADPPAALAAGDPMAGAPGLGALVDELVGADKGLVMCMGKGGVGKTTVAAALAVALAERGKDVLLTTTDPAAHLDRTVGMDAAGIEVTSIDPERATQDYRDRVMATKGRNLDDAGRAALEEDLKSPCTEEIAVFQAFSKAIAQADKRFVVLDTAPTGHTLLLMDATGSYHREVARGLGNARFTTPLMRLQDPVYTKLVIVTTAETTPVLEAQSLVDDLARAGIAPWAWVVNQTLSQTGTSSPLLMQRASNEAGPLAAVSAGAPRLAQLLMQQVPPIGAELAGLSAAR
ncbi:arsenical pump-driving ATPase [Tessaracoccus sp. MC1756]|uniref:arsenical pump-driving ATPase n=1 Tax=Tessaracoccus sp. MC1756 TaxID=2760311 RepID=UPI0016020ED3|nr:arsenical pump-driving ATPase [Tessaracoccus sp. MC1756]MBB1510806.1 arsenical pump-driving ATPase [Tessaracoccus sp. MC1756]